jgi:hypothetical protein
MMTRKLEIAVILTTLLVGSPIVAQPGPGRGPKGKAAASDPAFATDRDLFHELVQHRAEIRRSVRNTEHGVETLTESDKPEVAASIQKHVASMEKRVKDKKPIHRRDPLFAEVFRHAEKIKFVYEKTEKGVRVIEFSDDTYVVKLIQSHAAVVSLFLKNGFVEVQRDHDLPPKSD